jgi:hypothetical protein
MATGSDPPLLTPRRELLRQGLIASATLAGLPLLLPRAADAASLSIRFTRLPPAGSGPDTSGEIAGVVSGLGKNPTDLRVVVYAFGDKWYVQPTLEGALLPIDANGRWRTTIHLGTRYIALLVRPGFRPPATTESLPDGAEVVAAVVESATVGPGSVGREKSLRFSDLDWSVKSSANPVGPGPNYFSDDARSAWVDRTGRLHLRLEPRDGRWHCAEVVSRKSFGYGRYRFYLESPVGALDPNVVLGLFTWNDDPASHHREIDIEFSRWGDPKNQNTQYVIQPYQTPANISRFDVPREMAQSGHEWVWRKNEVAFRSWRGAAAEPTGETLLRETTLRNDVPTPGGENVRLNLWLLGGKAPLDAKPAEAIVRRFEFQPER